MSLCSGILGGLGFTILEALVLIFTVIATPTAQFRPKVCDIDENGNDVKCEALTGPCYTLWGAKEDCSKSPYQYLTDYTWENGVMVVRNIGDRMDVYGCGARKDRMVAASALAIVSIVFALILVIIGILMTVQLVRESKIPVIFSILCLATLTTTFALVANVFHHELCSPDAQSLKGEGLRFAEGFALMVTAFALQCISCVVSLVMC